MPSIVVLDDIAQEGLDLLNAQADLQYEIRTGLKDEGKLRETLAQFDGAILRSGVKITAASLEGNRRLKAIVRAGVGTDNIDKEAATRLGIVVMNTPAGNTISTAEHAFALMMSLSRNIPAAHQSLADGRWDRKSYMGTQLAEKTLGIVGLGRIGREVASRALAFQMRVIGYDPFLTDEQAVKLGIKRAATVEELLPQADYLTVHTPGGPETKDLIHSGNLDRVKRGIRLINAARGGIYNEAALVEGLQDGRIGGVALDVFQKEPCTDSPLFKMPNVVCTPHLGASTEEAQTQVAVEGIQLLINFFKTGEIRHAVNVGALDPKTLADVKGFLDVAYRLGRLLSQWHGASIDLVNLTFRGQLSEKDPRLLCNAFCAGLLEGKLDEAPNIVNAEMLLKERGVVIKTQQQTEMSVFTSSIHAEVTGGGRSSRAAGTLLGHNMPRLIVLEDYRLEAYLDGNLVIFTHTDKPGIIGGVGTVFGKHRVNIAQMSVGRAGAVQGGRAIGVLNLDAIPNEQALAEVHHLDGIDRMVAISLPPAGRLPAWLP
jgi:D-3-phosphoglycerate dehydrogenase